MPLNHLYQHFFELAPDACYVYNSTGEMYFANHTLAQWLDTSPEKLVGRTLEQLGLCDAFAKLVCTGGWDAAVQSVGQDKIDYVLQNTGQRRELSLSCSLLERDHEEPLIAVIARDISTERALSVKLEARHRALKALSVSNHALVRIAETEALLQAICNDFVAHVGFDAAIVFSPDRDQPLVASCAAVLEGTECREICPFIKSVGIDSKQLMHWHKLARGGKSETICCHSHRARIYPLHRDGDYYGLICVVENSEPSACLVAEDIIAEIVGDLSFGLQRIAHENALVSSRAEEHRLNKKLKQKLFELVEILTHAMDLVDPYTTGHQQRVSALSTLIAESLGLEETEIDGIRLGGLLHDIGKMAVPMTLLSKPGALTVTEFELIKTHSSVGSQLLGGVEWPWPIANMARWHHERLDGRGYPDGLREEQIPLEARILAVADVFEAMTSHRPYRPALPAVDALKYIHAQSGLGFDVEVVDALLALDDDHGGQRILARIEAIAGISAGV